MQFRQAPLQTIAADRLEQSPASAPDGTTILVATSGIGDFQDMDGMIAVRVEGKWAFWAPQHGQRVFVQSTNRDYLYNGDDGVWAALRSIWYTRSTAITGLGGSGATSVGWETETRDEDTWASHSTGADPEEIGVLFSADYSVRFWCGVEHSSGNAAAALVRPQVDTGGGFADYTRGVRPGAPVDAASFQGALRSDFEMSLSSGDVVRFQVERASGGSSPGELDAVSFGVEIVPLRLTAS